MGGNMEEEQLIKPKMGQGKERESRTRKSVLGITENKKEMTYVYTRGLTMR